MPRGADAQPECTHCISISAESGAETASRISWLTRNSGSPAYASWVLQEEQRMILKSAGTSPSLVLSNSKRGCCSAGWKVRVAFRGVPCAAFFLTL